jgi:type III pantothenate kinase
VLNLIIDIGNTRTKVALFKQNEMLVSYSTDTLSTSEIRGIYDEYPDIKRAIISTVRNDSDELTTFLKQQIDYTIELDHNTPLPIQNKYESIESLGKDRIAAAVGANHLFPNQDLLVIDAGTCITYDYVNAQNQYMGGFISPGLEMRFKALHHFTDKLPLLKPGTPVNYTGSNTINAIKGGVQYGFEGEISRMIQQFTPQKNELKIILTGGDKNYFEKLLKNHIFVSFEITLLGLNIILESNYQHNIN